MPMRKTATPAADERPRCRWCTSHPVYIEYHDREWGVPERDSRALFELLCLEGAQAGLSWWTILSKRDRYREVFHGFDPARVAAFGEKDIARLLKDTGIVRHRGKIAAVIGNARAYLALEAGGTRFGDFIWSHAPSARGAATPGRSTSPESEALSRALKKHGFRFVGLTTCYAFMQAAGLVDDHEPRCWRRGAGVRSAPRAGRPQR